MRFDMIDFPTGFELQKLVGTDSPPHDPRCSAAETGGAFLCDCNAIVDEWVRLGADPELAKRYRPEESK